MYMVFKLATDVQVLVKGDSRMECLEEFLKKEMSITFTAFNDQGREIDDEGSPVV